ncbi:Permease of the drug/metabolite transporter (DMT) superfamily [Candidatus Burkholderia humilis]|nr:Permease of the drug/metabolite transporter (DMT) superfamily [Candidatus Burkholderia humilis]
MLLVGSNVGIGKSIVVSVPVPLLALLCFVIALAVLWPLLRVSKMKRVARGEWINLFLQALFGTFGFTLLMLNGVARTIPAVVALFAWLFLKEKPGGRAFISIALAIVGVLVINVVQSGNSSGNVGGMGSFAGNLMVLGTVCCESLYVILSWRLTQTLPAFDICAYTHGIGFLLMLPLGATSLVSFEWRSVDSTTWALVVWYGLSASIFSFWLWMKGIHHVDGSLAGVFSVVLPIAAALYGIVFLDERPTLAHGIALACVVAGIGLAGLRTPASQKT